MRRTSALILSGSIGKGHDSVALACQATLEARGIRARTVDCMRMLGSAGSRAGDAVFRRILGIPSVYDAFHFSHLRTGTRLAQTMDRLASGRLVPKLRRELERCGPGTLLLPVFPTGAAAAGRLKAEVSDIATVALCTDACVHQMWIHAGVDAYLVCSRLAEVTLLRYQPYATVSVIPAPVRPDFYAAPEKQAARESLQIPLDAACVLIMAGGWGLGPLAESAGQLARAGYHVLAVAGLNSQLKHSLDEVSARETTVRPFGFTNRIPELMAAADAVITSPGQTCHEARVVGRPLILLDVVPGHGRENALHEIELGGAFSCSPFPDSVVGVVEATLARSPEPAKWPIGSAQEWDSVFVSTLEQAGVKLAG